MKLKDCKDWRVVFFDDRTVLKKDTQYMSAEQVAALGAVAVWTHHVAIVEQINADGSITTSESGYGCANPFWISHRSRDGGS